MKSVFKFKPKRKGKKILTINSKKRNSRKNKKNKRLKRLR